MIAEAFVDTQILVSLYDNSIPEKQQKALVLLDDLANTRAGVLSSQVLDELFFCLTRRIAHPLTPREASKRVDSFLKSWRVVGVTPHMAREAVRGVIEYKMNIWDAQIWATAKLSQIPTVLTESFSSRHTLEGVSFLNPFDRDFRWIN